MCTNQQNSTNTNPSANLRGASRRNRGRQRGRPGQRGRPYRPVCYAFINTGSCSFGETCKYSHQSPTRSDPSPCRDLSRQPQASKQVIEFASRIEVALRSKHFSLYFDDPTNHQLWIQSWAAVAVGARISIASTLLRAYLRLPASTALAPPAHDVLRALSRIAAQAGQRTKTPKAVVVETLQLVADAIEHRLLGTEATTPTDQRSECAKVAEDVRKGAHTALLLVISDPLHADRASRLLCRFLALLQRYQRELERISQSSPNNDNLLQMGPSWAGWRMATVDWLLRGEWLDAPPLQRSYDNVESYTETLRKFVTMLTFYWGAGALFPKCRKRGPDGRPCAQPLCAYFPNGRRRSCGRQLSNTTTCSAPAVWQCYRRGHDVACERCLRQMQSAIIGKPGLRASTDIYDAVVERETVRRDGVVYILSHLTSRKPPKTGPNWRTTYRLKCSALIGVVRLGASCEPLAPQRRLELAEIVPVNSVRGVTGDFLERQNGRLALRFLNRGDLSTLSCDVEALEPGARLAVIDLQVFVPEVLSVLSTISDAEFPDHLNSLPFSTSLTGTVAPQSAHVDLRVDVERVVKQALENTEIELIQRLSEEAQEALRTQLAQLAKDSNLDGTQLKAFAAALQSSIHCTQGPPGTGKSYLGVTLIRALDIIRMYAVKAGTALGPIVVLSYKNHALDEILLDVVRSDGDWSRGSLIRCGKPDNERLNGYGQRHSLAESRAQEILTKIVACIRWTRRTVRDWRSLRAALLTSSEANGEGHSLHDWSASRVGEKKQGMEAVLVWVSEAMRAFALTEDLGDDVSSEKAYQVLEAMTESWDKVEEFEQCAMSPIFCSLRTDMEHWFHTGPSRTLFLLERWLCGAMPPPRCAAQEEDRGCIMASPAPGAYCLEIHACRHKSGCGKRRDEGVPLCFMHRCTYYDHPKEPCQDSRLPKSDVCERHACPQCIILRTPRVCPKERGGRACSRHTCNSKGCVEKQSDGLPFCSGHSCRICLMAAAENRFKEIRSSERFEDSAFCKEHKCIVVGCVRQRLQEEEWPQNFCRAHSCVCCVGTRNRVAEECPKSRLCVLHKCSRMDAQDGPCHQQRENNSFFCMSHTCRICREEGLPLDRNVIDRPPRNVCALHPLCAFVSAIGDQCNRSTVQKNQNYCERHVRSSLRKVGFFDDRIVEVQCMGKTTKGRNCKARGQAPRGSRYYCPPHVDQRVESSSSESDDDGDEADNSDGDTVEVQCMGMTTKGRKCKSHGQAPIGSKYYCPAHISQKANSSSSESHEASKQEDAADQLEYTHDREKYVDDIVNPSLDLPIVITDEEKEPIFRSSHEARGDHSKEVIDSGRDFERITNGRGTADKNESTAAFMQASGQVESTESSFLTVSQVDLAYDGDDSKTQSILNTSETNVRPHFAQGQGFETRDLGDNGCNNEDGIPSTSESDDDRERLLFGICPDEYGQHFLDDDSTECEVSDQLQHLLDIAGSVSSSDSASDEEPVISVGDENCAAPYDAYTGDPREWAWKQPSQERWRRVAELLRVVCVALVKLVTLADSKVERARRERSEAAAFAFKKARLIGATVVGATRRLEAIRASEPFAMVVEEACEVLEPTLVSVLAVRSLRKLELIGDHRQLPAFVQPCWFSIETTHPTIKVSLFERLVDSVAVTEGNSGTPSCSILDVQRRMRPDICDLTRWVYDDVVKIVDDPCTKLRRIGGTDKSTTFLSERDLWCGHGILVPGIKPQVFFWDLETEEGRATVGLSRCNYREANACANLVGWLLHCGVPSTSITVITPYKGQKLTILRALRKAPGSVPDPRSDLLDTRTKGVTVSTVDQYQGDENDIIVLSLVCTKPGNRFVALRNRFIVAASRARIGFYIVGSSGAFTRNVNGDHGPSHWQRLLNDLKRPETTTANDGDGGYSEQTCGINRTISICCPRHRGKILEISEGMDFPQRSHGGMVSFCLEACPFVLPWCGHGCQVPCHSPTIVPHTSKCEKPVQRPCEAHMDVLLRCSDVRCRQGWSADSLQEALNKYNCEVMVDWQRPECSHTVQVQCHKHKSLLTGDLTLEPCTEVVADYVNPSCGHILAAPMCHVRRTWEVAPPQCHAKVVHHRPCGCKVRLPCHQSVHEASLLVPPRCNTAVSQARPRCSHLLSLRCHEAGTLRELWFEKHSEAVRSNPPLVVHGVPYGPSETDLSIMYPNRLARKVPIASCQIQTPYRSSCGHVVTVPCSVAFELAAGIRKERRCTEDTTFESPICGHQITSECCDKILCSNLPPSPWTIVFDAEARDSETGPNESVLETVPKLDRRLKKLSSSCQRSVSIERKCGHKSDLPCDELYSILESKKLPPCVEPVRIERSCGHAYDTVCQRQEDPPPVCNQDVEDVFAYPCGKSGHTVSPGTCSQLAKLRAFVNPKCPIKVRCIRARCAHAVIVPCHLERNVIVASLGCRPGTAAGSLMVEAGVDYCEGAVGVVDCLDPVVYRRQCGHEEKDIPCKRAFEWASSPDEAPPCRHDVEVTSPLCEHALEIACYQNAYIQSLNVWHDNPPKRLTLHFDGDAQTCPILIEDENIPLRPAADTVRMLRCGRTTRLRRSCGHEEDIPCETVFDALDSRCEHLEPAKCGDCGHEVDVCCYQLKETPVPRLCQRLVEKLCSVCSINKMETECFRKVVHCEREVSATLPCGHAVTWICDQVSPITLRGERCCLHCVKEQWRKTLDDAYRDHKEYDAITSETMRRSAIGDGHMGRFDAESLLDVLCNRARAVLPVTYAESRFEMDPSMIGHLLSAYIDILECNVDILSKAVGSNAEDHPELCSPPDISDAHGSYDLVYTVLPRQSNPEEIFKLMDTPYGFGAMANIISRNALEQDCKKFGEGGSISICVAAALKHRMLEDTPPFFIPRKQGERKKKKANKAKTKARMLMNRWKAAGFDHVAFSDKDLSFARVYWIPGAVVPLMKLGIRLFRKCDICLEDMLPNKGWFCPEGHFLCRECFNGCLMSAHEPDHMARTADSSGNLICPHDGCVAKYEVLFLLGQPHDASEGEIKELHAGLQHLQMTAHAKHEVSSALETQKIMLQGEFQRVMQIRDVCARQAEILRLEIVEQILTLRCPNTTCRKAFVDFEGCFDLTCSNCKIHFCAWCIKHSHPCDVHAHVMRCPEASGQGLFHSQAVFQDHHRKRRKRFILKRLEREDADVRKRALQSLSGELRDLGIRIEEQELK